MFIKFKTILILICSSAVIKNLYADDYTEWVRSNGSLDSSKYSQLNQINTNNINKLEKTWTFKSGFVVDGADTVQVNPIFTGKFLITTNINGKVLAINPLTGSIVWDKKLPPQVGRRGLAYKAGKIYVPTAKGLHELNEVDGSINRVFGDSISYLPPVIHGDYIFTANLIDGIEKFSLKNGEKIWHQTLRESCGVSRIWSGFSFDKMTGNLYVSTSDSNSLRKDHSRNCMANSVIAINSLNGDIRWKFQQYDHDMWDFDMVSPPIPFYNKNGNPKSGVIGLSKSGSIFILNSENGNLVNRNFSKKYSTNKTVIESIDSHKIHSPIFNLKDLQNISPEKKEYLLSKIKTNNFQKFDYSSSEVNSPVFLKGIHGGFEWPGGSLNKKTNKLVLTLNDYPWIIRSEYTHSRPKKYINLINDSYLINKYCTNCHGQDLLGRRNGELSFGNPGAFVPSIINPELIKKIDDLTLIKFIEFHKYSYLELKSFFQENIQNEYNSDERPLIRYARKILQYNNDFIPNSLILYIYGIFRNEKNNSLKNASEEIYFNNINESEFFKIKLELKNLLKKIDLTDIYINTFFQPLTDLQGLPATKPPWGKIVVFDILKKKKIYEIPFGYEVDEITGKKIAGSRNFGGLITTENGLIIANGSVDSFARIYDLNSGSEIWMDKLPFVGSAPPMTFMYDNCQYIIFTATGGRFSWFKSRGDNIVAYKLNDCKK
jgi:outer membrane protein assembly factor BamB